ncbi:MAG: hypothetical protein JXL85_02360 [Bacilli bacterium]|nr:hypothetical protein [Bacilli bacterium]
MEVNIDKLVELITENITKRTSNSFSSNKMGKSILFILPTIVFGFSDYVEYIKTVYKDYNIYFTAAEEVLDSLQINRENRVLIDLKNSSFLASIDQFESIILVSPKIDSLKSLSNLEDATDVNHILLGRLMANKPVGILLNVNNKVAAKLSKSLVNLRNIGFDVVNIQEKGMSIILNKTFITESDIMEILDADLKVIKLHKHQRVSPLARDKLQDNNIVIEYSEED